MKKIMKIFAAVLIAGLSFVSCKNNFSFDLELEENEKAYLSFAINEGEERKVAPDTLLWDEVDSIELTKNEADLKTWKTSTELSAYDQMKADNSIVVDLGKYNFAVTLKDINGDILQTGKINDFEIKGGKNLLNFETKAYLNGTGKFTIQCSYEDNSYLIDSVKYNITPLTTGSIDNDRMDYDNGTKLAKHSFDNVTCGEYIVKISIRLLGETRYNIIKTELVEIQNKRETVFNFVVSKQLSNVPIDYLLNNGERIVFADDVNLSSYVLGGELPSEDKILNRPKNLEFLGWFDDYQNNITTLPEKSAETVVVYALFGKTARKAEDFTDDEIVYKVIPTDDTFDAIYNSIIENDYYCFLLDLSDLTIDISDYDFSQVILNEVILPKNLKTLSNKPFSNNGNLKTVTIPEGSQLTTIGENAFCNCEWLTKVNFAKDSILETIGDYAFSYCIELKEITIPASVISIGNSAFAFCNTLPSVNIAEGSKLETIKNYAFIDCTQLKEITIPASVKSIGYSIISYSNEITKITVDPNNTVYDSRNDSNAIIEKQTNKLIQACKTTVIPDSVTVIGVFAFSGIQSLLSFTIPENITEIEENAFTECPNLKEIIISKNVTKIGESAFNSCENLEKVIFEDESELTSIGNYAFSSCTALKEITIPANVVEIGDYTFDEYSDLLLTIHYNNDSIFKNFLSRDEYLFKLILDDGITTIDDYCFEYCKAIKEIVIPESVTSIGSCAFEECNKLEKVTFKGTSTLKSIGSNAFKNCSALKKIAIPESVTTINDYVFWDCTALKELTIPENVTTIGETVFFNCSALEKITVAEKNTKYDSRNDCNAIIEKETNTLILGCNTTVIPNDVAIIGDFAFAYCELKEITIPASVTQIDSLAFFECTNLEKIAFETGSKLSSSDVYDIINTFPTLKEITIPYSFKNTFYKELKESNYSFIIIMEEGTTSIGNMEFIYYKKLKEVIIPSSVTSIGTSAFESSGLETITIPASVEDINTNAFNGCTSLTTVTFSKDSKLNTISQAAFSGCTKLQGINIPANVDYIGIKAFNGCKSLATVTFSENPKLTVIREAVFYDCDALSKITIPKCITEIEKEAFRDCGKLATVKFEAESQLESIGESAFRFCESLSSIEIPKGVSEIKEETFYYCTELEAVTMEANSILTSIGNKAFENCKNLDCIYNIPKTFKSIGDYAFKDCERFDPECTFDDISSLTVGTDAFKGCFNN